MNKRITLAIAIAVLAATAALPAQAKQTKFVSTTSTVPVTLRLSAAEPVASVPYKSCSVNVASGANGLAVLQAATSAGCISSYETADFGWGEFVNCIDGVCGTDATYWRMTENSVYTVYGVSDFVADAGDELGFSYTQWATCLAEPSLC